MRKSTIGIITTTIFIFSYLCSIFLSYMVIDDKWLAFGIGISLLISNIILVIAFAIKKIFIRKSISIPLLALNGIGAGLMVVAIMLNFNMVYKDKELLLDLGVSALICFTTYLVYMALLSIKAFSNHIKIYTFSFYALMIIIFILLLIFTGYWLFTGIAYLLMLFMIFALIIPTESEKEAWSYFYYSSIGAFAVVSLIALMVLAGDGDAPDGLSELIPDAPENPNKKKYYVKD